MPKEKGLDSFCRLCLTKVTNKVPIFGKEEENVLNLLLLIELDVIPESEPDAVVCFDCIVTLEGFFQFKVQCHENDQFLKTLPPKDAAEVSDASEEEYETIDLDYLEDNSVSDAGGPIGNFDSEEEGLVEDSDSQGPNLPPRRVSPRKSYTKRSPSPPRAKRMKLNEGKSKKPVRQTPAKKVEGTKSSKPQSYTPQSLLIPKGVVIKPTVAKRYDTPAELDPEEIERECEKLNIKKKRPYEGPSIDEIQVLKKSYPDYFYFEKGPRSLYFTLVYYGERFHSATFTERYTYWKCIHRRKQQCKAIVRANNDYGYFERRFEHTHGELKEKEGLVQYSPLQALPEIFRICRHIVQQKEARRRKAVIDRVKQQNSSESIEEVLLTDEEIELKQEPEELTDVLHRSGVFGSDQEDDDDD